MFTQILQRLQHALVVAVLVGAVTLAWIFAPAAGAAGVVVCTVLLIWLKNRGFFRVTPRPSELAESEASGLEVARTVVTQMLRSLTRAQVAYLSRTFDNRKQARVWLKKRLTGPFAASLDEMLANLENIRLGHEVPALRLAQRIIERRPRIVELEQALSLAAQQRPDHRWAEPMVFVETEQLDGQQEQDPPLTLLAGWDPGRLSLLPEVDLLTLYSEIDGDKKVRGQVSFAAVQRAQQGHIRRLDGDTPIFEVQPLPDPGQVNVPVEKVPMGFTVSVDDFNCSADR